MTEADLLELEELMKLHKKVSEKARTAAEVHEHQSENKEAALQRERRLKHLRYADLLTMALRSLRSKGRTKPTSVEESPGFVGFWEAYPRKMKKGDARTAWIQKKCEPLTGQILVAIAKAKGSADWRKDGGAFIPYPATWIRGECWNDDHNISLPSATAAKKNPDPEGWVEFLKGKGRPYREFRFEEEYVRTEFNRERRALR
jgi:hypothetical protein